MKSVMRFFLSIYIGMYRLTKGRFGGSMAGLGVLLLTTTGRKTGKIRTTPLGYIRDNENYVIIASNAGADSNPGWYFNVQNDPKVTIQVNDQEMKVTAKTADPDTRKRLWAQLVKISPRYGGYETKTSREIPMVILAPAK